jgi:hypothetical protein
MQPRDDHQDRDFSRRPEVMRSSPQVPPTDSDKTVLLAPEDRPIPTLAIERTALLPR